MANNAKEEALKILEKNMVGTMATVQQNKPHSRYMTFLTITLLCIQQQVKKHIKRKNLSKIPIHIYY